MNSFKKNLRELLAGNTDVGHVIVAKRAFIAGLRRAAEIAETSDKAAFIDIREEADEIEKQG